MATPKNVSFELERGIYINAKPIYPTKAKGKKTILSLPVQFAKELESASKGKITEEKPNTETPKAQAADELDPIFGEETDE